MAMWAVIHGITAMATMDILRLLHLFAPENPIIKDMVKGTFASEKNVKPNIIQCD